MKKYDFDEIINREDTDCVKYDLRENYFGKKDVIPMWVADMDFRTPDFIIRAIRSRLDHEILGYSVRGEGFYQSVIDWMKKRHDWHIEKQWISFSPGVVPALNMIVMAFTQPGDGIIVQPPVYFPFSLAIENNGRIRIPNPLQLKNGRLTMDFRDLKNKTRTAKMIFVSNPHNPGGSVWTKEELTRLSEICLENNVLMISDEIHSDLLFNGCRHTPLASLSREVAMQTITCNAPSKTFNMAGLATSYLIMANKKHLERYNRMLDGSLHLANGNIFGAVALQAAYRHGEEWLAQLLDYVRENILLVDDFLKRYIPQIKAIIPQSTYLIWLDCRELETGSDQLWDFFIRKAGVGFNDGRIFGEGGEGFMRMNVACPRQTVTQALEQIRDAVATL